MFNDDPSLSQKGGLSVAVPTEIKGLWELHKTFGKLKWKTLLKPVIELCKNGHLVSPYLENILESSESKIKEEKTLREIFINPETNKSFKRGEKIKRLKLAETLEILAEEGAGAIYGGEIGRKIVEDVKKRGGILSEEDLKDYR
jgi:gamma-glutamyltranspeptidase/glutathione hydrolase/leukotriene-C4 hydrolase